MILFENLCVFLVRKTLKFSSQVTSKMGVPQFVNWLVTRYPLIAKRMNNASRPRIDCFFVDFNCIIHSALINNKTIDEESSEEEIIKSLFHTLDILVQVTRPTSLLFISVDGPAPFAKCQQQRIRRFSRDKKPDPTSTFSSNSISVGTEFMENLLHKLLDFIQERIRNDINWSQPKIIYSSARTPGEGEHKFFEFVRAQKKFGHWNNNALCCVYSPDADLIFVCLQSHIKNMCIIRESNAMFPEVKQKSSVNDSGIKYFANDFVLISVNLIREYLFLDFQTDDSRLFDDFTALSYLIGNDFIPHIPDISVERGEFSIIVELYKTQFLQKKKFLVEDLSFNSKNLSEFLKQAALSIAKFKTPELSEEQLMLQAEQRLSIQMPAEYNSNPEELKRNASHAIIDSFYWVLKYYKNGVPSWLWSYKFRSAPSLIIVADYVMGYKPEFEIGSAPTPFEQLLCIMPYQSKNLIPPSLLPLLEPDSPIGYLYPQDYKTILEVPEADVQVVREAIQPLLHTLTPKEIERNTIIPPYLMTKQSTTFVDETQKILDFNLFSNDTKLPCVPSLFFYDIKPEVVQYPNVHQKQLVLSFSIPVNPQKADNTRNKTVLVDYPYFIPALVTQVSKRPSPETDKTLLKYHGIVLEKKQDVYLTASVLQFADSHESHLIWSQEQFTFPFQLTVPIQSTNAIERFRPIQSPPPSINNLAVVINGCHQNTFGTIKAINKNSFEIQPIPRNNPIPQIKSILNDDHKSWIPLKTIANEYKLSLDLMISALSDIHNKTQINIAFTLFKASQEGNSMKISKGVKGFCSKKGETIRINKLVVGVIKQYFEKTSPLLSLLQTFQGDKKALSELIEQFSLEYGEDRMMEIKQWVKENSPSRHFPMFRIYQSFPSYQTIQAIEKQLIDFTGSNLTNSTQSITVNKHSVVYKGQIVPFHQRRNMFAGSRVITLDSSGLVPFGTCGTVIGMAFGGRLAHVIADEEFEYGNKMRGYLTTNRGFVMETSDLQQIDDI